MDVASSSKGRILLSNNTDVDRPDSGIVIGAHPDLEDAGIFVGEHVLVMPYAGIWFRDVVLDGKKLWEVRYYGIADVDEYMSEREDISNSVIASIGEDGLRPTGSWVLLKRDENHDTSEGGIMLTDTTSFRNHKATVMAIGPLVDEVEVGDRVMYHGPSQHVGLKNLLSTYPDLEGSSEDYSLIRESGIYCVIES